MAGPAYLVRLALLGGLLTSLTRGQTPPAAPAVPEPVAPAATEPTVSPQLAKLFAGTPPKFDPPKPETATAVPTVVATAVDQPRNSIVRLPTYIVRGNYRLPDEYHMLTPQARQDAIVKRYVGEPSGLDVMLNKYTFNTLWKKVPLLGPISNFGWHTPSGSNGDLGTVYSSSTYKDRIELDYSKIEGKRLFIEALGVSADVPPTQPKPKDEKNPSVPPDK